MSIVTTHHKKLEDSEDLYTQNNLDLIIQVTKDLIENHSEIIMDIENGSVHESIIDEEIRHLLMKNPIIKNIDGLIQEIKDYMFGYGPLHAYVTDDEVSDIDFPTYKYGLIKRKGRTEYLNDLFESEKQFDHYCRLMVLRKGGVLNESINHTRVTDLKLKLRINVSIPPRNISGTSLIIRKHHSRNFDLDELLELQMFDEKTKNFVRRLMHYKLRIIIIGKGGSGKTTLLRAMLESMGNKFRYLICEKNPELYLSSRNMIQQRVTEEGADDLSQLVKDGLTLSLDGYCVGELIGKEVIHFIEAGFSDHRIIGTMHAKSPLDLHRRIQLMSGTTFDLSKDYVVHAFDIIIKMKNFKVDHIYYCDGNDYLSVCQHMNMSQMWQLDEEMRDEIFFGRMDIL